MATLEELRRENARLKAEHEVREDFMRRNEERKRLGRENFGLRHEGKISAAKRIAGIFKQTGAVTMRGVRASAPGIKAGGKALKGYGEYLRGPERKEKEHEGHRKPYYKKVGKGKYKKVYTHSKHHKSQSIPHPRERGFIESDIMRPTGNWGALGGY